MTGGGGKLKVCADGGDPTREWRRFSGRSRSRVSGYRGGINVASTSRHPEVGTALYTDCLIE